MVSSDSANSAVRFRRLSSTTRSLSPISLSETSLPDFMSSLLTRQLQHWKIWMIHKGTPYGKLCCTGCILFKALLAQGRRLWSPHCCLLIGILKLSRTMCRSRLYVVRRPTLRWTLYWRGLPELVRFDSCWNCPRFQIGSNLDSCVNDNLLPTEFDCLPSLAVFDSLHYISVKLNNWIYWISFPNSSNLRQIV